MFARPETVEQALTLLSADIWTILAGGTDFYPGLRDQAVTTPVLDITGLTELRGTHEDSDTWSIGALSSWSELIATPLPYAFDALKLAAREVGSVQVQNRATIAGNICNASPAADGVPPLLILDADVELIGAAGSRRLKLADFIQGNRKTARQPNEIVSRIIVPKTSTGGRSHFVKLGARKYLVISIAMVAARIETGDDGLIRQAAIAIGSCSEVAIRLTELERALVGLSPRDATDAPGENHLSALSPIDDVRATADYRNQAALELVRRTLAGCFSTKGDEHGH